MSAAVKYLSLCFLQSWILNNLCVLLQELVEWYTAIRSAKLNRLRIAYPGAKNSDVSAAQCY